MKRSGRLRPVSPRKYARSGKPGHLSRVRLYGSALRELRLACWKRDFGVCRECKCDTVWEARWPGDTFAYDMAHIRSRGAGGSDVLENVRTLCHACHMKEHNRGREGTE